MHYSVNICEVAECQVVVEAENEDAAFGIAFENYMSGKYNEMLSEPTADIRVEGKCD